MLNFVRMIGIQGRELKHVFMIFCRFDACEAVSFKLDMVIDMTKLYVMKAVWMTSIVTQGHWIMGKLKTFTVILL